MSIEELKTCGHCKVEKELKEYTKNKYQKDGLRRECKECERIYNVYNRKIENKLLSSAKFRAKKKNLEFDLTIEDIKIPAVCPVLGISLEKKRGMGKVTPASPSIDRIDNDKGYTKDNIKIISYKANTLKSYATKTELKKIIKYMDDKKGKMGLMQKFIHFVKKVFMFMYR